MSTLTLPSRNGSSVVKPVDQWLQSSVQDFFSAVNWDNHPPETQTSTQPLPSYAEPLSLEMSVVRFFASFNWDGATIAAPTAPEPTTPTRKTEFTLDDFSDLF